MRKFFKKNRKIFQKALDKLNGGGGIIRRQFYLQTYFLRGRCFFMKMKKFFLGFVAAAWSTLAFSQIAVSATKESDFGGKFAGIIDMEEKLDYDDDFDIYFYGTEPDEFDIYTKNPKTAKWGCVKSLKLDEIGQSRTVNFLSDFSDEMKKWPCAIVSKKNKEYLYIPTYYDNNFIVSVWPGDADSTLIVKSEPNPEFDGKHAAIYDFKSKNLKYSKAWFLDFYGNNGNDFEIYGKNPKNQQWQLLKSVSMGGFDSHEKIRGVSDSKITTSMKSWTFAIVPIRDVEYQFFPYIADNNLHLVIRGKNDDLSKEPQVKINLPNATILPLKKLEIEDYVKVVNLTKQKGLEFEIYAFVADSNGYRWESYGTASLGNTGDTETLNSSNYFDLENCKCVAINPLQDGDFTYTLSASHNDLYISVKNSAPVSGNAKNSADINFVED
jgi:hypothetical protein